jgi:hypothetical protein
MTSATEDHEPAGDRRLDGQHVSTSVGDGETDIDRGDDDEPDRVHGGRRQPPEGQRGERLGNAYDNTPTDGDAAGTRRHGIHPQMRVRVVLHGPR